MTAKELREPSPLSSTPLRAAIYARVSSAGQRDRHTIESQLHELPKVAAANGWDLVSAPYVDDGVSGTLGVAERPGLQQLLASAEAGEVDVVAVVGLDRLTRANLRERTEVYARLQEAGVLVAEGSNLVDLRRPEGEMYAMMMGWASARHRISLLEATNRGRKQAISLGRKPQGVDPFGLVFDSERKAWSIHAEEAAVVRQIYDRVAAGESCRRVAMALNRAGATIGRDRENRSQSWGRERIWRIVTSPTYRGEYVVRKASGEFVVVPAIVTVADWNRAQHSMTMRRISGKPAAPTGPWLLRELVVCGRCGQRMHIKSHGRAYGYYVCRARLRADQYGGPCPAERWRCDEADARVWDAMCAWMTEEAEGIARSAARARKQEQSVTSEKELRSRFKRLERAQGDMLAQYRRGVITARVRDRELRAIAIERADVEAQIAVARQPPKQSQLTTAEVRLRLRALRARMDTAGFAERREMVEAVIPVDGVVLHDGDIKVTIRADLWAIADGGHVCGASGSPQQNTPSTTIELAA